jgi:GH18 family chitinase
VTVYLLIDKTSQLQHYIDDLNKIDKANFNRVIFSFVRPTLSEYVTGSLANTGILGYFGQGDGKGVESFQLLLSAVRLSKAKYIEAFLSVGGWNYSCKYEIYGSKCGDPSNSTNEIHYDWFPDPTISSEEALAKISYSNIVKLTVDLEMDGLDFDYEEFWHADDNAVVWYIFYLLLSSINALPLLYFSSAGKETHTLHLSPVVSLMQADLPTTIW